MEGREGNGREKRGKVRSRGPPFMDPRYAPDGISLQHIHRRPINF